MATAGKLLDSDAENTLRGSAEKYRALLENIDEAVCVLRLDLDADGALVDMHFLEVNPAFERQTGLIHVAGKSTRELFPNLESHWREAALRVMQTGRPEYVEDFNADLGRWFGVRYARIGGDGSRLLAVVFADVSERKRTEATASRLAAIVEGSDDAIIRKDLNGIIETWNAGAERIFGYSAEEVIGKPVTILMPPDRVNEEPGILARIRRGERVDHYETVRQRKDGSLLDISLTVSPVMDAAGNIVAASKIARDITERKTLQAARRVREGQQSFLLKLSDALRGARNDTAVGETCVRMLAEHLDADRCYITRILREEDRARLQAEYRRGDLPSVYGSAGEVPLSAFSACLRRMETGALVINDLASEPDLSDAEKDAIRALRGLTSIIGAPLRAGERTATWALVVGSSTPREWSPHEVALLENVAERTSSTIERVMAEEALHENQVRLQNANRVKDEFLAMLGHELRNPLAPITTTLQLMKLRSPDVFVHERDVIEAQVQYLASLVDDLLDVARIASGKLELKCAEIDLGDVVDAAVETTRAALEERHHALHVQMAAGLKVWGDRRRLVQVLVNLLGNAAKYSPRERNIWLAAVAEEGQAVLRVRDEGQGIGAELLPHVFELFSQGTQAIDRAHGGLGLGLAIVRNLVTLHGGTVAATSDGLYKGSEFIVRLPLLSTMERADAGAPAEMDEADVESLRAAEKVKVLIVDDYVPAAESLALLLQEMGYHTQVANDGAAALQAVKSFHPHIALVDIGLPVIDGYEVAQTVRRTPGFEHLPLVAVTGYGQASDRVRALASGFTEHVVKPLNAIHISELIERLVTRLA